MKKLYTLTIGLLIGLTTYCQKNKKVELNWKIEPQETLTYQTVMNDIDTSIIDSNFKVPTDSISNRTNEVKDLYQDLNNSFEKINLQTDLTNNGNGVVEVVIKTKPKEYSAIDSVDTTDFKLSELMSKLQAANQGVMLRGSVYETGSIHSFWVKNEQRNLIALFFELPNYPVRIGDSWELDINLISNDQNFECDTAHKINKVTLTDIIKSNGEKIAIIEYNIKEFVDGTFHAPRMFGNGGSTKTTMLLTHQAVAKFSINRGRWISYDGIMRIKISGFMTANTQKKFSLNVE